MANPLSEVKFRQMLIENYAGLNRASSPACIDAVVDFIEQNPSIQGKDIQFVKVLTKVADHIMKNTSKLDHLLERLYHFNMDGVARLQMVLSRQSDKNQKSLESHLLAYAADTAGRIAQRTNNTSWNRIAMENHIYSADIIKKEEAHFAKVGYLKSLQEAKVLLDHGPDLQTLELAYSISKDIVKFSQKENPQNWIKSLKNVSEVTRRLYTITNEFGWGEKNYYANVKIIRIGKKNSIGDLGVQNYIASQSAFTLYQATLDSCGHSAQDSRKWAERSYHHAKKALSHASQEDSKIKSLWAMGNAADARFKHDMDITWAKQALDAFYQLHAIYSQDSSNFIYKLDEVNTKINFIRIFIPAH